MTPADLARLLAEKGPDALDREDQRRLLAACAEDDELAAFVVAYRDVHALTGLACAAAERRERSRRRLRFSVAAAACMAALALAAIAVRLLPSPTAVDLASIPLASPPPVTRTQPPLEDAATAVLASWTPSAEKEPRWLTSLSEAQAIAAATRRPVLLYVFHPECPWCMAMNRVTWPDARVSELTRDVIPVKVNVEETTREFQEQLEGWPWITLEQPDGRVLRAFPGYREADSMSSEIRSGLEAAGLQSALPWEEARRLAAALDDARDAESRGRLGEAQGAYESLLEAPPAFAEEAREGLRRISEAARRALLQAQRAAQEDPAAALLRLEEAATTFRGTPHERDLEAVREALARTGRFPMLQARGIVG